MKTLPDKKSELLKLALNDLAKAEKDPDYEINMNIYHRYREDKGDCIVCLAGSVMAFSLKQNIRVEVVPSDFDEDTRGKLLFLDACRAANFVDEDHIHNHLENKLKACLSDMPFIEFSEIELEPIEYSKDRKGFIQWIEFLISFYEDNPELNNNKRFV